uniref:Uncharacterized protein n=1 Tax=Rhizophora mucronata TaxID=61149 RepID=A0A2P2Q9Y5_RHIMU
MTCLLESEDIATKLSDTLKDMFQSLILFHINLMVYKCQSELQIFCSVLGIDPSLCKQYFLMAGAQLEKCRRSQS